MASINDKGIVDQITSNDGVYTAYGESDPPVTHIIEYGNMFDGRTTYSLAYSKKEFEHQWATGFFAWKQLYWTREDGFQLDCEACQTGDHYRCRADEDFCQDGVDCPDYLSEGCKCQNQNHYYVD